MGEEAESESRFVLESKDSSRERRSENECMEDDEMIEKKEDCGKDIIILSSDHIEESEEIIQL